MKKYERIISSIASLSSIRMLIGATSTIYMIDSGVELYHIGMIKSMQAVIILVFGLFIGIISDRVNRKNIHTIAIFFSFIWLYLFYLGGIYSSLSLFYLAEFLNGISLCMIQNNSSGYLVEQFKREDKTNELDSMFGKLNKWTFIGMSLASLIGGVLYYFFSQASFLYTSLLMLCLFIFSLYYLPRGEEYNSSRKLIDKKEIRLIFRKISKHSRSILSYVSYGLFFQVIIQYWQVMVYDFELIAKNNYWLGLILCLLMLAQSVAGQAVERKIKISKFNLHVGSILNLIILILAVYYSMPVVYIAGLCFIMFSIRYISIVLGAELQSDLKNRFRSKYNMVLNSLLRIITAITLFIVGFLLDYFDIDIILYLGIGLISINVLLELLSKDEY
ncbi:MFS transporter [Bibersteinia trehalosi]|uniref:MFS transporter n=1 Tax=Bibersteinia trehalosi TaxID=47735 RepID=UPI0040465FF6